jgi:hypothetical protein
MYLLAQKFKYDRDGYPVKTISHLHNGKKYLCGVKIKLSDAYYPFGDFTLKSWLIEKTTCEKCRSIAEQSIKQESYKNET